MIRVVLAEDHMLVREGLKHIMREYRDIEIIGEVTNGIEAIELVKKIKPDILLLDIDMPKKDGIEATRELTQLELPTKILILTHYAGEEYAEHMLLAGADGFIMKDESPDELIRAIRKVVGGSKYLPAGLANTLALQYVALKKGSQRKQSLSQREFEVMRSLVHGKNTREIAEKLHLSVKTVDSHRRNILRKLEVRNNTQLIRYAIQHRLVEE